MPDVGICFVVANCPLAVLVGFDRPSGARRCSQADRRVSPSLRSGSTLGYCRPLPLGGSTAENWELRTVFHHTRHGFSRTMGEPGRQAKAFGNSGILESTPLTRNCAGECGSTSARSRSASGVMLVAPDLPEADKELLLRSKAIGIAGERRSHWLCVPTGRMPAPSAPGGRRRCRPCSRPG